MLKSNSIIAHYLFYKKIKRNNYVIAIINYLICYSYSYLC